jgi:hypothetical protein
MKEGNLKSLSIDKLWGLREEIAVALVARISVESRVLEDRLRRLRRQTRVDKIAKKRRPYPIVLPPLPEPAFRNLGRKGQTTSLVSCSARVWKTA